MHAPPIVPKHFVEIVRKSHFHYFNFYLLFFSRISFHPMYNVHGFRFCLFVLLSFGIGGSIRLYTEKLKSQPIISVLEENPLPIQYISFAGFENSEVQFFYNCSHIDTSAKSVMGWFNAKIFKRAKFVIVYRNKRIKVLYSLNFFYNTFNRAQLPPHVMQHFLSILQHILFI